MKTTPSSVIKLFSAIWVLLLFSCNGGSEKKANSPLIIHELTEPAMLNPINYMDATSEEMCKLLFQRLLDYDYKTNHLVPVLAESLPIATKTPDGNLLIKYKLKSNARWDNGSPITPKDVEFSLKTVLCPGVNNDYAKENFALIKDFIYDDEDPLGFSILYSKIYTRAEYNSGAEYFVIPAYVYDKANILSALDFSNFTDPEKLKKLSENESVKKFSENFNSEKFMRDPSAISGSGAFKLNEWKQGQQLKFKRKENWWAQNEDKNISYFDINVNDITYKIIQEQTTALAALKGGSVDVLFGMKAKDFKELSANAKFTERFNLIKTMLFNYSYIGLNTTQPGLNEKAVRKALAHCIDLDQIIKVVNQGYAEKVLGPVHPSKTKEYDNSLKPYLFNTELAASLLKENNWADSDKNGIADKIIDGKRIELRFTLLINSGNEDRKTLATIIKDNAKKAGIEIDLVILEWSAMLEKIESRQFDMYYGAWGGELAPDDHAQLFGTKAITGGSNYTSFGNQQTDALIDSIKVELNEEKRGVLNKRFQRLFFDECHYLFLTSSYNLFAINKLYQNTYTSSVYPGFWAPGFKLKTSK